MLLDTPLMPLSIHEENSIMGSFACCIHLFILSTFLHLSLPLGKIKHFKKSVFPHLGRKHLQDMLFYFEQKRRQGRDITLIQVLEFETDPDLHVSSSYANDSVKAT